MKFYEISKPVFDEIKSWTENLINKRLCIKFLSINKVGVRDTEGESNITSRVNKGELRVRVKQDL